MKKLPLLLLALVAAGLAGAWFYVRAHRAPAPLRLYGNVDIREVSLGFRVAGRLQEMLVDEGDAVQAGQTLGRLDSEPYRHEVQEAQAQLDSLLARLELLQTGNRPQEIAQARALVHEREVTATNAMRLYVRQQELLLSRAVAVQERDDAEAHARETEARLHSAREQLNLLEAGFRLEDIAQAKAEVARSRAALAAAQLRVQDSVLLAPAAGVVLTRAQEPGAILQPSTTVLSLSLERPVWVRAFVHEPEMGKLHPGQKVDVWSDSRPNKPYSGQVGYISPRAEFTPKNVETAELRTSLVYRLRIVVDNADAGLRQGMPVSISLAEPSR